MHPGDAALCVKQPGAHHITQPAVKGVVPVVFAAEAEIGCTCRGPGEFSFDTDQPIGSQLIIITGLHAAEHAARVGGKCRKIVSYHVLVGGHATEMAADIESVPSIDRLHQWRGRASRQIGGVDRCAKRQGARGDNICYSQLARHQGTSSQLCQYGTYTTPATRKKLLPRCNRLRELILGSPFNCRILAVALTRVPKFREALQPPLLNF